MATKRQYTEDDKATALAMLQANGGNITRVARELHIPASTLRKWRAGEGVSQAVAAKCDQKKEELDGLYEQVARAYLGHALGAALKKTSGKDAVIAAATATDKMRLLREQPTSITGDGVSDAERVARFRALVEQFRRETSGNGSAHHGCETAAVDPVPGQGRPAEPATPSV